MIKGWRRHTLWLLIVLVSLLLANACNNSDGNPDSNTDPSPADGTGGKQPPGDGFGSPVIGETGRAGFVITWQHIPDDRYSAINLTITGIELLSDDLPAATVFSGEQRINLLSAKQFGQLMALADRIPAGVYNKIRLTLKQPEGLELIPAGGGASVYPHLPGNGKIDLNLRRSLEVIAGELLIVQLDMDATKSIHEAGSADNVQFRPVVFVDVLTDGQKSDLLRIDGYAHSAADDTGTFIFCLDPVPEDVTAEPVTSCLPVSTADASLFDRQANPAQVTDIVTGKAVTVAGVVEGFSAAASLPVAALHDDDDDDGAGNGNGTGNGNTPQNIETRLLAEVVEIDASGNRFRLQATIKVAPSVADDIFVFDSLNGLNIPGQLQPGARILNRQAVRHDFTAITVGRVMGLDGAPSEVGEANAMNVTLALLADDNGPVIADQLDGVIQSISATSRILMLDDVMVTVVADAMIISTRELDGVLTSELTALTDLVEGGQATAFGQLQADGSFVADIILLNM